MQHKQADASSGRVCLNHRPSSGLQRCQSGAQSGVWCRLPTFLVPAPAPHRCAGGVGLSIEQRKRLSIAVELVANPSVCGLGLQLTATAGA